MKLTTLFTFLAVSFLGTLSNSVAALPVTEDSLEKRNIWSPTVLYPHNGTVWHSGQQHNITWFVRLYFLSKFMNSTCIVTGTFPASPRILLTR